jgi:predicted DNA-binding mobile mystery protein A
MESSKLRRQQLDRFFSSVRLSSKGPWLKEIREALGMSTTDLARRMGVIQQRVSRLEQDEKKGKVTLDSLARAADAMNCELVYFFVPKGSLENFVQEQARKAAKKLVKNVDATMSLEDQKTSKSAREKLIEDTAQELVMRSDRSIWKVD